MMTAVLKQNLSIIAHDRRKRSVALLVLAILCFFVILLYKVLTAPTPPPEGVLTCYKCVKCRHTGSMIVKDIRKHRCPECGGIIMQIYKCSTCDYEFPYERPEFETKDMRTYDVLTKLRDLRRCPNCGEDTVFPKAPDK